VAAALPELPDAKRQRFLVDYGLSAYDAGVLTATRELADYFEATVAAAGVPGKLAANWVTGELAGALNRAGREIGDSPLAAEALAGLLRRIEDGTLSGKLAKQVFEAMWSGAGSADEVIEQQGLRQITDTSAIEGVIRDILEKHPKQLEQYRGGQEKLLGFFVGQVMKATQGKANPAQVNELLKKLIGG
jgi:aspartyl-tRNA(Asn)/glutamyl-tRNA(Gln) amidotransferase subunit B